MDAPVLHLEMGVEDAAENPLLPPLLALAQLAVSVETGELGAGSRSAGRPVVGPSRAQDEIARVGLRGIRGGEQLDVIDLGAAVAPDAVTQQGVPDPARIACKFFQIGQPDLEPMMLDQEEPVAAPGNVSAHEPDADVSLDAHDARADLAEMRQRCNEPDRAVPAHADVADVVEEDDAEVTGAVRRTAQQRPDDGVGAPRLVNDRRAPTIVLVAKHGKPLLKRPVAEVGPTLEDEARRLASRVGIEDRDPAARTLVQRIRGVVIPNGREGPAGESS